MKRFFRHFAFAAFGVSILCLALGIAMLIWTATAMKWISYGFGAVMILSGILQIASYLTGERVGLLRTLLLLSGNIAAVAGVWILLTQSLVLLYHGIMDCKHGLDIKSCEAGGWSAALVLGVCICAAGVLLLVNPFEKNDTLLFAAALGFLLDGISGLFTTVAVAHGKSRAEFLAGQAPVIELDPAEAAETLPDSKTEPLPESEAAPADTEKAEAEAKTESPAEKK